MPNGGDIAAYLQRMAPGDILSLASGGAYTLGAGVSGFTALPNGTAGQRTTVRGNGATVTGGNTGISLTTKTFIDFSDLTLIDQTNTGVSLTGSDDIRFTNVSARSAIDGYLDTWKLRNVDRVEITGGTSGPVSTSYATCDGVEFWGPCNDCTVTNHHATGYQNGPLENDGHGFEVYGENAGEICDNIQFVNCVADTCRVGFSCEGGASSTAVYTNVLCTGCSGSGNTVADYQGKQGATLYRTSSPGTTAGTVVDV